MQTYIPAATPLLQTTPLLHFLFNACYAGFGQWTFRFKRIGKGQSKCRFGKDAILTLQLLPFYRETSPLMQVAKSLLAPSRSYLPSCRADHNLTHFPIHPKCPTCVRCKCQRVSCPRAKNIDHDDVRLPTKYGDALTGDHKILENLQELSCT